MGRKKKTELEADKEELVAKLKSETVGWILAIGLFAIAIFFMLASMDKAGVAGQKVYSIFSMLFGLGFYLLPIVSMLLSIAYARSYIRPVTKIQCVGAFIFFVSSLALINIISVDSGGIIGNLLSTPLIRLFDFYVTAIILVSLIAVSILIIFDVGVNFSYIISLFKKKSTEIEKDQDVKISGADLDNKNIDPKDQAQVSNEATKPLKPLSDAKDREFSDLHLNSKMYSKPFIPPPLSLLEKDKGKPGVGDVKANANIIKRTLQNFGIIVEMDEVSIGPSVTRYALKPAEGVKLSKILGLQNNLELALAAHPVRIEAPIPGKSLVGIEMPNTTKTTVGLGTLLAYPEYSESEKPLIMSMGKDISGGAFFANMAKMPHMLIAGATGSGKSVTIHVLINSLLFRNPPSSLKFIMIDPKRVELTLYNKIPHLLTPVITEPKKAILALKWAAKEMDRRYNILEANKVRDIDSYHKTILAPALERAKNNNSDKPVEPMPYIVVIIDELADIMQSYPRELESAIVRLAQMSRAVGIHLILSTQRPSVNVITGLIKANVPARVALQVASQIDSRTILDMAGAEKLLGAGDMLFMSGDMSKPVRLQSPYISETEVKKVVEYLKENYEDEIPNEINLDAKGPNVVFDSIIDGDSSGADEDDLYDEAKDIVVRSGKASTSFLQRKLRIGYARAARIMDILEEHGVIGPGDGAKQRDVLIKPEEGFSPSAEDSDEESSTADYE